MLERMTEEMREVLNEAIRYEHAAEIEITPDYVDQGMTHSVSGGSHPYQFFASYTPYGVACIEAAFYLRMKRPFPWDSKDQIRREILSNPHLHLNIKERLLIAFEQADWARWHDRLYCHLILDRPQHTTKAEVQKAIEGDRYLTDLSRANLLHNLEHYARPKTVSASPAQP